jgi:hypothetical protein
VRAYLHLRVTTALSPVLPCLFALLNLYKILNIIDYFRTKHFAHGLLCVQLLIQIWHLLFMDKCKHASLLFLRQCLSVQLRGVLSTSNLNQAVSLHDMVRSLQ